MTHVMLDLETMGTTAGCAIVSIGAQVFDNSGLKPRSFKQNIALKSCTKAGLRLDPDTVQWWLVQSDAARSALLTDPQDLKTTLSAFSAWLYDVKSGYPALNEPLRLWSHGASFDLPILGAAYDSVELSKPWTYGAERCCRTMLALAGMKIKHESGTHHNALDDARAQAVAVIEASRKLNIVLK